MAPPPRGRNVSSKTAAGLERKCCMNCDRTFSTEKGYEAHLLKNGGMEPAPDHFACHLCFVDHRTMEGLKRHCNQMHAAEQSLQCPACKKMFNRLGGLVGHLELMECPFVPAGFIQELRAQDPHNSGQFDRIREAAYSGGLGSHASPAIVAQPSDNGSIGVLLPSAIKEKAASEEDLINLDEDVAASHIMNAPWEEQQSVAIFNKAVDFPALASLPKNVANIRSKVQNPSAKSPINAPSMESSASKSRASMHKPHKPVTHVPEELNNQKSRTLVHVNSATATFATGSPLGSENKGRVMLEQMGWSQGTALGAIDNRNKLESVSHAPAAIVPAPAIRAWNTPISRAPVNATPASAAPAWNNTISRAPVKTTPTPPVSVWDTTMLGTPANAAQAPAFPAWGTTSSSTPASATLFPNAPPAVLPPVALMENLSISTPIEPISGGHDPQNPTFNPERYYSEISRAYTCPDPGCRRGLKSVPAFMQHIMSGKHRGLQKVSCPKCHRLFVNSTALTQHFESQAIRCDARKLGNADVWVKAFTQVAEIGGKNEDDTNKYVNRSDRSINPGDTVASVIEASRRAVEARANMQENY